MSRSRTVVDGPAYGRGTRLRATGALLASVAALVLSAGCSTSTDGASVNCTVNSCTATFDRGVHATASVLGIDVKLVNVSGDRVTVEVAGTEVTVPASGGSQEAGGLAVHVEKITSDQVVLQVTRA